MLFRKFFIIAILLILNIIFYRRYDNLIKYLNIDDNITLSILFAFISAFIIAGVALSMGNIYSIILSDNRNNYKVEIVIKYLLSIIKSGK